MRARRTISDAPYRTIRDLELWKDGLKPLGSYGWKVGMGVTWGSGAEYAHLYLDGDTSFLFYFMSW